MGAFVGSLPCSRVPQECSGTFPHHLSCFVCPGGLNQEPSASQLGSQQTGLRLPEAAFRGGRSKVCFTVALTHANKLISISTHVNIHKYHSFGVISDLLREAGGFGESNCDLMPPARRERSFLFSEPYSQWEPQAPVK